MSSIPETFSSKYSRLFLLKQCAIFIDLMVSILKLVIQYLPINANKWYAYNQGTPWLFKQTTVFKIVFLYLAALMRSCKCMQL